MDLQESRKISKILPEIQNPSTIRARNQTTVPLLFFSTFRHDGITIETAYYLRHTCPSVCRSDRIYQRESQWTYFRGILYCGL